MITYHFGGEGPKIEPVVICYNRENDKMPKKHSSWFISLQVLEVWSSKYVHLSTKSLQGTSKWQKYEKRGRSREYTSIQKPTSAAFGSTQNPCKQIRHDKKKGELT